MYAASARWQRSRATTSSPSLWPTQWRSSRPSRPSGSTSPKPSSAEPYLAAGADELEKLGERERTGAPRGDEEVLPVRRLQDRVEALPARARMERDARAVREDPVHREPRAVEVVARRREDDEMEARRRLVALVLHVRPCAPEERVVERVEIRPLRHGCALRIEDSVVAGHVCLQAGGRLQDRAG